MVDGLPSAERFASVIGNLIGRLVRGGRRVAIYGEMVALLALERNQPAVLRLEELWNELQRIYPFALGCDYPMHRLQGQELSALVDRVCAAHGRVIPTESYTSLQTSADRLRAIAVLQQKAYTLEAEIVERKRAEEQLRVALVAEREALAAAQAAFQLRNEFLSVAAHELKTPLTALKASVQLLLRSIERDGGKERAATTLRVINGQTQKLSRLMSQLLDVSHLEAGRLQPELRQVDLAELVSGIVSIARTYSDNHSIVWEPPGSLLATVDPDLIERVLTNLLDNAIKFSQKGGPICVALARPKRQTIELSVRDHGIGIPPESRDHVFERFFQAHTSSYQSGFGLGLDISRHIAELHGGDIRAEFPHDGGSRFVVRLPAADI